MKDTKNNTEESQSEATDTIEVSDEINDILASLPDLSDYISPALQQSFVNMTAVSNAVSPSVQQAIANMSTISRIANPTFQQAITNMSVPFTDYLRTFDINEIVDTIEDFSNSDFTSSENEPDVNELSSYIENELNSSNNDKLSFNTFIKKIAVIFGVTTAIAFISTIVLPYLLSLYPTIVDNHQVIVDTLQETFNSLISMFGDNVIAMATVKDVIQKENLSDYEHLSLIGLIRKDTYLRKGSSKNAPLAFSEKVKVNTVVNLLEVTQKLQVKRKQNWLKIQVKINDDCIEGWVEESKVQRFRKI